MCVCERERREKYHHGIDPKAYLNKNIRIKVIWHIFLHYPSLEPHMFPDDFGIRTLMSVMGT
jgi:hypothetical protein